MIVRRASEAGAEVEGRWTWPENRPGRRHPTFATGGAIGLWQTLPPTPPPWSRPGALEQAAAVLRYQAERGPAWRGFRQGAEW